MDQASLNEHETRRIKLTELVLWSVKPTLFLGRGPKAKWFVLHQALNMAHLHRDYECRDG